MLWEVYELSLEVRDHYLTESISSILGNLYLIRFDNTEP